MNQAEVLQIFKECNALLEGHFILTSGLRSPVFLQKARVFMHADKTEILCRALAEKINASGLGPFDAIVSPAVGGLIPGYETSRHLNLPALYVERENGEFRLRRFEIEPDSRILVVEDIVSTGLSIRETLDCLRKLDLDVRACACLVDRTDGEVDVGVPLISLTGYKIPAYAPEDVPAAMAAIEPVKPGSRGLSK